MNTPQDNIRSKSIAAIMGPLAFFAAGILLVAMGATESGDSGLVSFLVGASCIAFSLLLVAVKGNELHRKLRHSSARDASKLQSSVAERGLKAGGWIGFLINLVLTSLFVLSPFNPHPGQLLSLRVDALILVVAMY